MTLIGDGSTYSSLSVDGSFLDSISFTWAPSCCWRASREKGRRGEGRRGEERGGEGRRGEERGGEGRGEEGTNREDDEMFIKLAEHIFGYTLCLSHHVSLLFIQLLSDFS